MIRCGDTFLAGPEGEKLHLRVVATEPLDGEVAVVSITTCRSKSETLVVLQPDEHPWLKDKSVVAYAFTSIVKTTAIEAVLNSGDAVRKEPASAHLLHRIQTGLIESDRTPAGVISFALAAGLKRD